MTVNYATKRLLAAGKASLTAWEGEEHSVREEHAELIEELQSAIFYFDAHGATQRDEDADLAEAAAGDTCTACERDSLDCSRDPCEAVIVDRAA
jgi:hypothetical protein